MRYNGMIANFSHEGYKFIIMTDSMQNPLYKEVFEQLAEIERRIASADIDAVRAILAKVPDRPPLPGDEINPAN
jgi:adenine/guanine phosphoribosyltransferase-like PRPP-binding protein